MITLIFSAIIKKMPDSILYTIKTGIPIVMSININDPCDLLDMYYSLILFQFNYRY
ncbi:hypothetical protein SDC9_133110 [bioreactor metagenome]|uniref:Uncharacterized protein n=1 Tax=bioreactor metagenome TaxID=1076179 RepID=A0A645DA16_9ZZZZ